MIGRELTLPQGYKGKENLSRLIADCRVCIRETESRFRTDHLRWDIGEGRPPSIGRIQARD